MPETPVMRAMPETQEMQVTLAMPVMQEMQEMQVTPLAQVHWRVPVLQPIRRRHLATWMQPQA